jgi:hypothetical protein
MPRLVKNSMLVTAKHVLPIPDEALQDLSENEFTKQWPTLGIVE